VQRPKDQLERGKPFLLLQSGGILSRCRKGSRGPTKKKKSWEDDAKKFFGGPQPFFKETKKPKKKRRNFGQNEGGKNLGPGGKTNHSGGILEEKSSLHRDLGPPAEGKMNMWKEGHLSFLQRKRGGRDSPLTPSKENK